MARAGGGGAEGRGSGWCKGLSVSACHQPRGLHGRGLEDGTIAIGAQQRLACGRDGRVGE